MLQQVLNGKKPSAAAFAIPSHFDNSPEYARLARKKVELQTEQRRLSLEKDSLAIEINTKSDGIDSRVAKLIGGGASEGETASLLPDRKARCAEIGGLIRDIVAAIAEVDRRLGVEAAKSSKIICGNVKAEYDRRVGVVIDAMLALHEANLAYRDFTTELNDSDVSWTSYLPVLLPTFLGHPRDHYSRTAMYLRECVKAGYLTDDDIPGALRMPE